MENNVLNLLIIEDDLLIVDAITEVLPSQWKILHIKNINEINQIDINIFQVAFIDLHLSKDFSKIEGLNLIKKIRQKNSQIEIVVISGNLNREIMEKSLSHGATKFLAKPLIWEEFISTLDKIKNFFFINQNQINPWIGQSKESKEIRKQIAILKNEPGPILIEGESGSGKEIVARLLHQDISKPFITVNISAISENLFESELFGHIKGSFTGANQNKKGLIELASNGDLFLDEIEALPINLQVKLLRFLENYEILPVGSEKIKKVNLRVIIATNQNLNKLIEENKFREDLYWRISGKKILIPPLRKRKEDIEDLANFFLEAEKPKKNKLLHPDAIKALKEYHWPGNVRELKRFCEQISVNSPLPYIRAQDVNSILQPIISDFNFSKIDYSRGLDILLNEYESSIINECLSKNPSIDKSAQILQISRSNLYKKIKEYHIDYNKK